MLYSFLRMAVRQLLRFKLQSEFSRDGSLPNEGREDSVATLPIVREKNLLVDYSTCRHD